MWENPKTLTPKKHCRRHGGVRIQIGKRALLRRGHLEGEFTGITHRLVTEHEHHQNGACCGTIPPSQTPPPTADRRRRACVGFDIIGVMIVSRGLSWHDSAQLIQATRRVQAVRLLVSRAAAVWGSPCVSARVGVTDTPYPRDLGGPTCRASAQSQPFIGRTKSGAYTSRALGTKATRTLFGVCRTLLTRQLVSSHPHLLASFYIMVGCQRVVEVWRVWGSGV